MAHLTGKGAYTGVNLVALVYNNGVTKNKKSTYADVQVDHRDDRAAGQTNLHLKSEKVQAPDGSTRYNNGAPYSMDQLESIIDAAGPNKEPIRNKAGEEIGTVYGLKANVMPSSHGKGLVINTKDGLGHSDFKVDSDTLDQQIGFVVATRDAKKAAQAQAEPVAQEVQQQQELAVG